MIPLIRSTVRARVMSAALVVCLIALPVTADSSVELILDASGSMWNKVDDGRFRIVAAKEVLQSFVAGLPADGLDVGLRIYGSKIKAGQSGACDDTALMVPIAGLDRAALSGAIKGAKAIGATPIARSLELAAADFTQPAERKLIVLVTDGEESCDGDVRAAAEKLRAAGVDVDLRIIGFDLDAKAQASFEGLGTFENAADAKALAAALGRAVESVVPPLGAASLEAPEQVPAGQGFEVGFTGENGERDYVTIVEQGAEEGAYAAYQYTRKGSPLSLIAPMKTGAYELRYQSDRVPGVAARRDIEVVASEFGLSADAQVPAGKTFTVEWIGPDGPQDYITMVPADAADGVYKGYQYTRKGSPLELHAPIVAGTYELRYQSDREEGVWARIPIEVVESPIQIIVPPVVQIGQPVDILWSGPDGKQDYVTLVEKSAADGKYAEYVYTRTGSPARLFAPSTPGSYEVRYQSDREGGVFARVPLEVKGAETSMQAPEKVEAGTSVEVSHAGINTAKTYITVVPADAADGEYKQYFYTRKQNPMTFRVPAEPGRYELRYQSDADGVFARRVLIVE